MYACRPEEEATSHYRQQVEIELRVSGRTALLTISPGPAQAILTHHSPASVS